MPRLYPANPNPHDSWDVLPMVRDLYSRRPETQDLEPWELQQILWSLGYSDELLDEAEIAAAVEVARTHFDLDEGVA
jgi:hypothetical protein